MSPDLLDRIKASLNSQSRNVSPRRIIDIVKETSHQHQSDDSDEIDIIWDSIDPAIRNKLNSKEYKIKRFRESVADLLNQYSPADILRMDISCVKNNGKINSEALEHILYDE